MNGHNILYPYAQPPLSPTHNFLGIQGNLKDVSKEFLGNHQIPQTSKIMRNARSEIPFQLS